MPTSHVSSDIRSAETLKDLSLWHGKKEVIKNLYVHQKRTLGDVKTTMEREHGFPTTLKLSDYEHVLREEFKYRKNLSADEWRQSIGPEIARREAAGKRSTVFLNGSKVKNVDRRIRRSLQNKRSRRCAKANTAALPYGVVIRTPSPQPLTLALPFGKDLGTCDLEQHAGGLSSMKFLEDYKAEFPWLSSLMDRIPLSGAHPGVEVLSVQLLRQNSPINQFLILLNEYQRKSNLADLRLFGPNATVSILGKICFDFSNHLHYETISRSEMTSILNWIGFQADIASLKTFFAQKRFTILAAWEALHSTILRWQHPAALDVFLSVHLSIRKKAPWAIGGSINPLLSYLTLAPNRVATLINAYSCDQLDLNEALQAAIFINRPIELVKQLLSAGASFKTNRCRSNVDDLIRYLGSQECEAVDLALLKTVLEAGAVVDEPNEPTCWCRLGWQRPDRPIYATDYLILSGGHSTHNHGLFSLVSSYSNRQQTTISVPGIFEAAQHGQEQLRSYLNARSKPDNDYDRKRILEIALSEASERGYTNVLQCLVQFGVDPNVRMLSKGAHSLYCQNRRCDIAMLMETWHPVIRTANTGKLDTLRILVTESNIDAALLDEELGSRMQLDLCALRHMEDSQLSQILRLLSILNLAASTRNEILLHALEPGRCCSGHDGPDFGFVDRLLGLGLASLDQGVCLDGQSPHLLVRAIQGGCGSKALSYLVEKDIRLLSTPSIGVLLGATLKCVAYYRERQAILEFLSRKFEGFDSYVQENSSSLLSTFLGYRPYGGFEVDADCTVEHGENDCETMVTVQWLLGLGATLDFRGFTMLIPHANESFLLERIDSVPEIKVADKSFTVKTAIDFSRFNLAVALIERGVQINDSREPDVGTILQCACEEDAPLWFVRFLVDKGADVNAPPPAHLRYTALQFAVGHGSMNMAGLLLDYGADVNAPGWRFEGETYPTLAIDVAVECSRLDMVHFLIAAGARSGRPGLTGVDGAITKAIRCGHLAIAALLRKHGDSCRGDRMEAEKKWLQANPDAPVDKSKNKAQAGPFMGRQGEDSEADFDWEVDDLKEMWSL